MALRKAVIAAAASAALSLCTTGAALAHAHLVRTTPSNGETVKAAPAEVVITFDKKVEPAFTSAIVRDASGNPIDKAVSHVDETDPATVRISLPPLGPGEYAVEWRAMAADTHKVNGNFKFRVVE